MNILANISGCLREKFELVILAKGRARVLSEIAPIIRELESSSMSASAVSVFELKLSRYIELESVANANALFEIGAGNPWDYFAKWFDADNINQMSSKIQAFLNLGFAPGNAIQNLGSSQAQLWSDGNGNLNYKGQNVVFINAPQAYNFPDISFISDEPWEIFAVYQKETSSRTFNFWTKEGAFSPYVLADYKNIAAYSNLAGNNWCEFQPFFATKLQVINLRCDGSSVTIKNYNTGAEESKPLMPKVTSVINTLFARGAESSYGWFAQTSFLPGAILTNQQRQHTAGFLLDKYVSNA